MAEISRKKPLVLLTINGWGVASTIENNAIRKADVSDFKNLVANYPSTVISPCFDSLSSNYEVLGSGRKDQLDFIIRNSVSKILDNSGLSQIKIADSENFPLLSVFFNNQEERFVNEEWKIVREKDDFWRLFFSSDERITHKTINAIKSTKYDFIFCNLSEIGKFALEGKFEQTILKTEKTSIALRKISQAVLEEDGVLIVLGSFGAAEDVFNVNTKIANLKKTNNSVPLIIIGSDFQGKTIGLEEAPNNDLSLIKSQGDFSDIAPTILKIMGFDVPTEMTGESFI